MPDVIVKIGGGLLAVDGDLDIAVAAVGAFARACPTLVVPGGGPFADAVRDADRRFELSDDAAHWMAVLAMDQYAHLVVSRLEGGRVVFDLSEAEAAQRNGRVPVLAPFRLLREQDPLPHTWDVTSDSIAAWVAGAAGARELVLVKPRGATGSLVDPGFAKVLPRHVAATIVPVDELEPALAVIGRRIGATRAGSGAAGFIEADR